MSFDNLFKSKGLVYRALENNAEHNAFIHRVMTEDQTLTPKVQIVFCVLSVLLILQKLPQGPAMLYLP